MSGTVAIDEALLVEMVQRLGHARALVEHLDLKCQCLDGTGRKCHGNLLCDVCALKHALWLCGCEECNEKWALGDPAPVAGPDPQQVEIPGLGEGRQLSLGGGGR